MKLSGNLASLVALAAAVAAITPSCADEAPLGGATRTVSITASVNAPEQSRTAMNETAYDDGLFGMNWTDGDAIGVYGGKTTVNAFFYTNQTGGRVQFTGSVDADDTPLYAYYPFSGDNQGRPVESLAGTLPLNQQWKQGGTIDGDYKVGRLRNNTDNEFDFNNIFALLRIRVNATGTGLAGEQLTALTIAAPAERTLGGSFEFNGITGAYAFAATEGANELNVKWEEHPELTEGATATAYASCAPEIRKGDRISITVETTGHKATFTATAVADFAPNTLYTFPLTLSNFADESHGYTEEETGTPENPDPIEDENEETANCYMITTAGAHNFKATVIGNGQKGIIPGAGFHTDNATINPTSAKLLWEDVEGFVTDVTLRNGRVYYQTTGNVGNAQIAVYDASGTILWSWHIWGVGDTLPEDFDLATKGGSTFTMMDRDLGAFPSTDEQRMQETKVDSDERQVIHAMLYQWGRKDPFPNTDFFDGDGNAVSIATSKYNLSKPAATQATIVNAVRNPTSFIDLYQSCSKSDWLYEHNYLLWGDDRFSGQNDGGWTNVKTIYDPSPVGYRVANYYAYTSFIPNNSVLQQLKGVMSQNTTTGMPSLSEKINCVIETYLNGTTERWLPRGIHMNRIGMSADSKKQHGYGIFMKRNDSDTEGNFFAQTGYVSGGGTRTEYGITSYRWMSCGAVSNTIDCGAFNLYYFAWRTAQSDYTDSDHNKGLPSGSSGVVGTIKTQMSLQPRYGCAIRCVREK